MEHHQDQFQNPPTLSPLPHQSPTWHHCPKSRALQNRCTCTSDSALLHWTWDSLSSHPWKIYKANNSSSLCISCTWYGVSTSTKFTILATDSSCTNSWFLQAHGNPNGPERTPSVSQFSKPMTRSAHVLTLQRNKLPEILPLVPRPLLRPFALKLVVQIVDLVTYSATSTPVHGQLIASPVSILYPTPHDRPWHLQVQHRAQFGNDGPIGDYRQYGALIQILASSKLIT